MFEDEFEGRPLAATWDVLAFPLKAEAKIRRGTASRVRAAAGSPRKVIEVVRGALAWLAYLPAVLVYEAFAIPLVAGTLFLAVVLVAIAFTAGAPFLAGQAAWNYLRRDASNASVPAVLTPSPVSTAQRKT